jgi:hypothetical protein
MKELNVVEAKETDHGTIIHRMSDGSQREWAAIRAGLSLPTEEADGYFIILGEKWTGAGTVFEGQKTKRGKILLLAEQEVQSPFLDDTLKPLSDECSLVGCSNVYAEFEEEPERNMETVLLARDFINEQKMHISLLPAPFHGKFKTGVDIIRFYLNNALLDLPESSPVSQQLAVLSQADLIDKPEVKFVAINGLRFAIGSFHKNRPWAGPPYSPPRKGGLSHTVRRPRW